MKELLELLGQYRRVGDYVACSFYKVSSHRVVTDVMFCFVVLFFCGKLDMTYKAGGLE